jgi:3-hydroxybutyryl-CoA dehydrogenase
LTARAGTRAEIYVTPHDTPETFLSTPQEEKTSTTRTAFAVRRVAVLGAGTMGHGIAQAAAAAGFEVTLRDVSEELVGRGMRAVEANLSKGVERGKVTEEERGRALSNIRAAVELEETAGSDLFVEAVPERLDLKRETLRAVESLNAGDFIFATNTSSLSISEIAEGARDPGRVVGMHFFNPVHIMRLVEIVAGRETSPATVEAVRAVALRMKKEPIVVRDVPGFASSRLGVALGLEAMRMVEEGVAAVKDIDTAMELGYNHPMGPLRLTDLVGLDVRLHIAEYLHSKLGSERFRPPDLLRRMVAEGKLGKKSGEGFYKWENK